MRVLLVRPVCDNERFGLGPFFRVEPLGLEYVAAALLDAGHEVRIVDLRFAARLEQIVRSFRPGIVGIACAHTVDIPSVLATAARVKQQSPEAFVLIGGHAASVYPAPLLQATVDAVCIGDGEETVVLLTDAIAKGFEPRQVPGLLLRIMPGVGLEAFLQTAAAERHSLDRVPLPARSLVSTFQKNYLCVYKMPVWAIETSRGCPYRCSFCSIWRHNERSFRLRSIEHVVEDFRRTGPNVFVIDDLFFQPRARSLELAKELTRRNVKKDWILVQTRLDTVARSSEVLAAWRPLAKNFDLFFGFEAPKDAHLDALSKDMTVKSIHEGVGIAREYRYGVTGNFLIDPDWGEDDFQALWEIVDQLSLERTGYTILTPLPGTPLFDAMASRLKEHDWSRWDMHHILWEPKLGRERFFELFVESWRRNVLNPKRSRGKWIRWIRGLNAGQVAQLGRVLWQTRRLLQVDAYLKETFPLQAPALVNTPPRCDSCGDPRPEAAGPTNQN